MRVDPIKLRSLQLRREMALVIEAPAHVACQNISRILSMPSHVILNSKRVHQRPTECKFAYVSCANKKLRYTVFLSISREIWLGYSEGY